MERRKNRSARIRGARQTGKAQSRAGRLKRKWKIMVGTVRFELTTLSNQNRCATHGRDRAVLPIHAQQHLRLCHAT